MQYVFWAMEQISQQVAVPHVWPSGQVQVNVLVGLHGSGTVGHCTAAVAIEPASLKNNEARTALFSLLEMYFVMSVCGF